MSLLPSHINSPIKPGRQRDACSPRQGHGTRFSLRGGAPCNRRVFPRAWGQGGASSRFGWGGHSGFARLVRWSLIGSEIAAEFDFGRNLRVYALGNFPDSGAVTQFAGADNCASLLVIHVVFNASPVVGSRLDCYVLKFHFNLLLRAATSLSMGINVLQLNRHHKAIV
jgi:hypothetical protein